MSIPRVRIRSLALGIVIVALVLAIAVLTIQNERLRVEAARARADADRRGLAIREVLTALEKQAARNAPARAVTRNTSESADPGTAK